MEAQTKATSEPQRFRLLSDDDGHDYIIPVGEEKQFEAWVAATSNDEEYEGKSYEDKAIGGAPSLISFTDPRID